MSWFQFLPNESDLKALPDKRLVPGVIYIVDLYQIQVNVNDKNVASIFV